jgi:hypothetical protein
MPLTPLVTVVDVVGNRFWRVFGEMKQKTVAKPHDSALSSTLSIR